MPKSDSRFRGNDGLDNSDKARASPLLQCHRPQRMIGMGVGRVCVAVIVIVMMPTVMIVAIVVVMAVIVIVRNAF